MRKILVLINLVVVFCTLQAQQRIDVPNRFYATSEKDMYKLFEQLFDTIQIRDCSARSFTPLGSFREMDNDTVVIFKQYCEWIGSSHRAEYNEYICKRFTYFSYISNRMPVDFYKRFLNYLQKLSQNDDFYIKRFAYSPLYSIKDILIKQYESGKLNERERLDTWNLIEQTALMTISGYNSYSFINWDYDKYMTDKIRQALVYEIENPIYPAIYLDSYMSLQDTTCVVDIKCKYDEQNN